MNFRQLKKFEFSPKVSEISMIYEKFQNFQKLTDILLFFRFCSEIQENRRHHCRQDRDKASVQARAC